MKNKKSRFFERLSFGNFQLRKENISGNGKNCENDSTYCCEASELLFLCLALIFAEEGIAGCAADSAGKTAFFGALEKNEQYDSDGNEDNESAKNVRKNSCHFINLRLGE